MIKYRFLLSAFLFFLLNSALYSNEKILPRFKHYYPSSGLSHSGISYAFQDSKGFMWFGTLDGLNKFDGTTFTVFRHQLVDSPGLPSSICLSMDEDVDGNLWIGTIAGLCIYDYEKNIFMHPPKWQDGDAALKNLYIESILVDNQGHVWIGTEQNGLLKYVPDSQTYFHYKQDPKDKSSLANDHITSLFQDNDSNIWVGFWTGDVQHFQPETNDFKHVLYGNKNKQPMLVKAITQEMDTIWVATQGDGVYKFAKTKLGTYFCAGQLIHNPDNRNSISSNDLLSICSNRRGGLWIGTENHGLNYLNIKNGKIDRFVSDPYNDASLSQNSVWETFCDNAGNIWVGTYAGGINFLSRNQKPFRHFKQHPNGLSHNTVSSFAQDKDSTIWIGLDGGGINRFDLKTEKFQAYNTNNSQIPTDAVLSLSVDAQNILWIGTWAGGLCSFDKKTEKFTSYTTINSDIACNNIFDILPTKDGRLWLAGFWGGVVVFDKDQNKFRTYNTENSSLGHNQVRSILKNSKGTVFAGTEAGLYRFNHQIDDFEYIEIWDRLLSTISGIVIYELIETSDSLLWVGSSFGAASYDPTTKRIQLFGSAEGLHNTTINSIVEDRVGNIWFSTNGGISKLDRNSGIIQNYTVIDGLQSSQFYKGAGLRTFENILLFGGVNGFNTLDTRIYDQNTFIPPIYLTEFKIFNKPVKIGPENSPLNKNINLTTQIDLSYKHSVFSFGFAALNFSDPEKNKYAYKLENFDTEWNFVGTTQTATYTNIDPGNYVFQVIGSNNDGNWNREGVKVNITIHPPFWQTWWANTIYILLFIGIIFAIMQNILARERLKNAHQLEHIELEKMYELDQQKSRFFYNVSHEFKTPIMLILSPIEHLLHKKKLNVELASQLNLIYRSARRLLRMTTQLLDFEKLEADQLKLELVKGDIITFIQRIFEYFQDQAEIRNIDYQFYHQQEVFATWFDPDKLDKIIFNLLGNAFKFTPRGGSVQLKIEIGKPNRDFVLSDSLIEAAECAHTYAKISVIDSGVGISEENLNKIFGRFYQAVGTSSHAGSGIGLSLSYELTKLYQGDITVNSKKNKGTCFTVFIPLDRDFLIKSQNVQSVFNKQTNEIFDQFNRTQNGKSGNKAANSDIIDQLENKNFTDAPIILIVDDDIEIHNYIKMYLGKKYSFLFATDGEDGLQVALDKIPDLIICDIMMPKMDGFALCEALKKAESTDHIPIIVLTAHPSQEVQMKGHITGADVFLAKPFNTDMLETILQNLLDTRRKLRERYSKSLQIQSKEFDLQGVEDKFLKRFLEIVENNLQNPNFTAESISRELGIGRVQLYRKLKNIANLTVHELIRKIRLQSALQLLENKRMTITEIAFEVGFNDLTYFARCFRKEFGESPSQYRSLKSK